MNWIYSHTGKSFFIAYHNSEEILIACICFIISARSFSLFTDLKERADKELLSRVLLVGSGFVILGMSSLIHAIIHAFDFNLNLLYQTLIGYCFGLFLLIIAIFSEKPQTKIFLPLFYIPLLALLLPDIHSRFPVFGEFRPLVWISVSYLAGLVCMLHITTFYRFKDPGILWSAAGFALICVSAIFLFFPTCIGSPAWLIGHIFRPIGFALLLFGMTRKMLGDMGGSILYRALTAFSLLAALPLLIFGTVIFYEEINRLDLISRRLLVFLLMLVTLASAFIFGLGMIIRLVRPILQLKDSVDQLGDEGLSKTIEVTTNDEIGELSNAFNEMVVKLGHAVDEQERLGRLAATGELAATLAHEIKNPLNAIGGAATYIRKNFHGSLIDEFIGVISDEASRINRLTGNLLDFAKPLQWEPEQTDINKLIQDMVSLLREEAKEQTVTLHVHLADDIPMVNCDRNRIKQVLINLLINSFDAVDNNGEVTISSSLSQGGVLIAVADNGRGIDPANLKEVFNPFFTTKTRGTGLGLAISKKIAKEHLGDLVVESLPGQGCTFTLILKGGQLENAQ